VERWNVWYGGCIIFDLREASRKMYAIIYLGNHSTTANEHTLYSASNTVLLQYEILSVCSIVLLYTGRATFASHLAKRSALNFKVLCVSASPFAPLQMSHPIVVYERWLQAQPI
jgi:hypothetical protein